MESLAKAAWRAKIARHTPPTINIGYARLLEIANQKIAELEKANTELKGRIGGLMAERNKLPPSDQIIGFLTVSQVAEAVSREFGIAVIDMQSERRTKEATLPRQVAMHLSRKLTNRSFPVIANFFGKRDHTTAMHAYQKIVLRRAEDLDFDARIERLEQLLLHAYQKVVIRRDDTPAIMPTESVEAATAMDDPQSALANDAR